MKILFGQLILARGLAHREMPHQFSLTTRRETQTTMSLRANTVSVFDRGNARTEVKLAIAKRHESAEHALRFAASHPQSLAQATGGLTFVSEDAGQVAETFLPDAVLRALRCVPTGLVTDTVYEFIGSELTTQPATA